MRNGLQNQLAAMGESSCYFLSLVKIAEEVIRDRIDLIWAFDSCVTKRYVRFIYSKPEDGDNCYIDNPLGVLKLLTGRNWNYHKVTDKEEIKAWSAADEEYTIQRWYRKTTGKEFYHFRRPSWDPLLDSQTVKFGAIDALYIFTVGG